MKTRIGKLAVLAVGLLTIGVFASRGQIATELEFKAAQPFTVANTTLAAGTYEVRPVSGTDAMVVEIAAAAGKPSVFAEVNFIPADPKAGSHVVFNKYSKLLALSQIFPGGGNQGYELLQGHPEKMAAKTEKPTKQTVASTSK